MAAPLALGAAVAVAADAVRVAAAAARGRGLLPCSACLIAAARAIELQALLLDMDAGVAGEVAEEVRLREQLARPALAAKVAAGARGAQANISGASRARRNIAQHALLGSGVGALSIDREHGV